MSWIQVNIERLAKAFRRGRKFDRMDAFFDLVIESMKEAPEGSVTLSERLLASRWNWSRGRVRRYLEQMVSGGVIKACPGPEGCFVSSTYSLSYNMVSFKGGTSGPASGSRINGNAEKPSSKINTTVPVSGPGRRSVRRFDDETYMGDHSWGGTSVEPSPQPRYEKRQGLMLATWKTVPETGPEKTFAKPSEFDASEVAPIDGGTSVEPTEANGANFKKGPFPSPDGSPPYNPPLLIPSLSPKKSPCLKGSPTGPLGFGNSEEEEPLPKPAELFPDPQAQTQPQQGDQLPGLGAQAPKASSKSKSPEKMPTTPVALHDWAVARLEIPEAIDTPQVRDVFLAWCEDRKLRKRYLTPNAIRLTMNKLAKYDQQDVEAALQESIANGWVGVFPKAAAEERERSVAGGAPQVRYMTLREKQEEENAREFKKWLKGEESVFGPGAQWKTMAELEAADRAAQEAQEVANG